MLDGNNNWQRTNVFAGGALVGTYDSAGLHFHLSDPLGTRRMQLSGNPNSVGQPETDIQSLPYGDQLYSFTDQYAPASADDATPLHFTGKERDAESGNDYFGARYYASSMGRFMSPDDGIDQDPDDPQSWNLYSYVRNNPLADIDPDGHACQTTTITRSFPGFPTQTATIVDRSGCQNGLDALSQNF
jgi:RHS repeat-associated protein